MDGSCKSGGVMRVSGAPVDARPHESRTRTGGDQVTDSVKLTTASDLVRQARAQIEVEIFELRDHIESLRRERDEVVRAPLVRTEAKARIDTALEAARRRFLSDEVVRQLVSPSKDNALLSASGRLDASSSTIGSAIIGTVRVELTGALALLPGTREALHAAIDGLEYAEGLPLDERPGRVAEIEAEVDWLEHSEEQLVRDAEDAGFFIARRPDARPEIILDYVPDDPTTKRTNPATRGTKPAQRNNKRRQPSRWIGDRHKLPPAKDPDDHISFPEEGDS